MRSLCRIVKNSWILIGVTLFHYLSVSSLPLCTSKRCCSRIKLLSNTNNVEDDRSNSSLNVDSFSIDDPYSDILNLKVPIENVRNYFNFTRSYLI